MAQAQRELIPRAVHLLSDEQPCALFYDLDLFRQTLCSITEAFPSSSLNAIAMKANPLSACLLIGRDLGMGCEVASPAELEHALRADLLPIKSSSTRPRKHGVTCARRCTPASISIPTILTSSNASTRSSRANLAAAVAAAWARANQLLASASILSMARGASPRPARLHARRSLECLCSSKRRI